MSEECCGPDEPRKPATVKRIELTRPLPAGDACCSPDPRTTAAERRDAHDAGDACCGPDTATGLEADEVEVRPPWWRDLALLPSALSGLFLLAGYILEWTGLHIPALVLQWAALLAGAYTFIPGAIRRLIRGRLGVGLLMTIAAIGAVALGHVGEAATLAFLFSLAEALEDRAMDRAKEGLRALLSLIPDTVRISRLTGDVTIPAADVREFDILVVGAGDRIATDGVVVEGRSSLDTSAITGESIPVEVGPGDTVAAGSVNGSATLRIEATANGRDNSLTQIVALVEQAHARKGDRARLADRIARPLVPAVLIAAALVALFGLLIGGPWTWIERALVVLVAASPCALAIAVPVTVISAIGAASKFGVVIKSGEAFEQLGTIRAVALDKTGTLTRNEPAVVDLQPAAGVTHDDLVAWAAAVEATSTHPLAAAITAAAPGARTAADVVEDAGHGITGTVEGKLIRVGNTRWLDPADQRATAESMAAQGMTVVVVEADGTIAGLIGVRDELRPESAETVRLLQAQGIETIMLTGDNTRTAHAIANQAGITDVRAEQLPADKAAAIEALVKTRPTAMVGDGINDAPALVQADVGMAIGTGTDVAVESADIVLMRGDLNEVPAAIGLSRATIRNIKQNLFWAFVYNLAGIPLAAGVFYLFGGPLLDPIFAGAAMALSSVSVVSNALRLRYFKVK